MEYQFKPHLADLWQIVVLNASKADRPATGAMPLHLPLGKPLAAS